MHIEDSVKNLLQYKAIITTMDVTYYTRYIITRDSNDLISMFYRIDNTVYLLSYTYKS